MAIEAYSPYVAKSGTSIIVPFRNTSTLKDVTLAAGAGNATISINGGAPITLTTKRANQGMVFLPSITGQTFSVGPTDAVTLSAPSGWVTSSPDSSPTITNMALTNYSGVEHLTIERPSGSLLLGYNVQKPSYFNPVPMYNNWVRNANRFLNANSTYDSNGYPTSLVGTTEAILMQANSGSEPWDAMPQSGTWTIMWDGASGDCTLGNQGGNTTVTPIGSSTGNATNNFRTYSVTVNTLPGGIKYSVTAVPVSNIRIYAPGDDPNSKFRPTFLTQLGTPTALRFLDAFDTNSSNVINYSDFSTSSVITYFRQQNQPTATVSSFEAWTNDGGIEDSNYIYVLCTTTAAHNFTTGMTIDFSGTNAIACNSGAFTVSAGTNRLIRVVSATTFSFGIFRTGGGTVDGVQSQPGTATALIDIAGTMPLADAVELCNLKGADLWINVPHMATDACCTSLAQYIAANLSANLRCICEFTNEHWNSASAFNQFRYCYMQGQYNATIVAATSNKYYRGNYWYAQRAAEVHDLFQTAWNAASRPLSTLVRLVATQYGNTTVTANVIHWYKTQLGKQLDAMAFAPYWGTDFVSADSTLTDQCTIDQLMEHAIGKGQHDARQDVTRYDSQLAELTQHGLQNSMYIYETGADIFAAGATPGSEKSRAVGRHPRMRQMWNWRLKKFESQGFKRGCIYLHGNLNLTSGGGGTNNTNWSVWLAHDQVAGLGDGSDGLFNNTSDYDNHASVVSVQGHAINIDWMQAGATGQMRAGRYARPPASDGSYERRSKSNNATGA